MLRDHTLSIWQVINMIWQDIINLLPSLILIIICMTCLLMATGIKYSLSKTLYIIIPFLIILIGVNIFFFSSKGGTVFDDWALVSVFFPEFLMATLLGKRKGMSLVVAIINAYVAFYIVFLLRSAIDIFLDKMLYSFILYVLVHL